MTVWCLGSRESDAADDSLDICRSEALKLIPTPTPRWPDLLCAYHAGSRLLFTSKLFSAHVAPSASKVPDDSPFDVGGWGTFEPDWRFFFDCMLAPVARQAAGAACVIVYMPLLFEAPSR